MLKRTKGRLLISLLVVTGLAGTMDNNSVTQRERKYALNIMKEGKVNMHEEEKGLSEKQLNFTTPAHPLSIKQCLMQMAFTEQQLWETVTTTLKKTANPERRRDIKFSDDEIIQLTENGHITAGSNTFKRANAPWKNVTAAISGFKTMRNDHIKYMKNSTEDLRNHVTLTPAGWVDCYQYILIMSAETNRYIKYIAELKNTKGFPAK